MSDAAQADYVLLLCHQYLGDGLPADPEQLRRLVGRDRGAWPAVWAELEPCFPLDGPGRRNLRLERAVEEREAYLQSRSEGGRTRAANAARNGGKFTSAPASHQLRTSIPTSCAPASPPAAHQHPHQHPHQPAVAVAVASSSSFSSSVSVSDAEVKGDAPAARSLRAKPTLAELESYLRERRSLGKPRVDPEAFMAHYESNGWRVGRHPMKNWRAAVVTWEKNGLSVFRRTANNGKVTAEQLGEFNRQWREREERNGKA